MKNRFWLFVMLITVVDTTTNPARAQEAYPMLMSVQPVAATAGSQSEHTISSRYSMYGATEVRITGDGVTADVVAHAVKDSEKIPSLTSLRIIVRVDEHALPGIRDVRVLTPRGVSTVGQIVVTQHPVRSESKANNTRDEAEAITLPATVCGRIEKAEDVDFFRFSASAGRTLTFSTLCMRLQDRIHDLQQHADPILTIRNESGGIEAISDNAFFADPCLAWTCPRDGDYLLEIRDVRYQGNGFWEYMIEASDQPVVASVHPLAIATEQAVPVTPFGPGVAEHTTVIVPAASLTGTEAIEITTVRAENFAGNPFQILRTSLGVETEAVEPNDMVETAQSITVGSVICGQAEVNADVDCFRFAAKKDERLQFELFGRRLGSSLDSNMRILSADGKQLIENDDLQLFKHTHADSRIDNWVASADGDYILEVRDLHLRGGRGFPYAVAVTPARPSFDLYLDTDKTQLTPDHQGVLFVNVQRRNGFSGEIALSIAGLPDGVSATCDRIPADARDAAIILKAAPDAVLSMSPVTVTGTARIGDDESTDEFSATANALQETYQPGGGRGHWPVSEHIVAVGEPGDLLAVSIVPAELSLKPGESARVDVEIVRKEGFDKNVQLDVYFRHLSSVYADTLPKGVTIDSRNSSIVLNGTATKGHITFVAAKDAPPIQNRVVAVMANMSLNFVMKRTYSSEPLLMTIEARDE